VPFTNGERARIDEIVRPESRQRCLR